jgi:hypothetical protein
MEQRSGPLSATGVEKRHMKSRLKVCTAERIRPATILLVKDELS